MHWTVTGWLHSDIIWIRLQSIVTILMKHEAQISDNNHLLTVVMLGKKAVSGSTCCSNYIKIFIMFVCVSINSYAGLTLNCQTYVKDIFWSTLGNSIKEWSEVEKCKTSECFLIEERCAVYGPRRRRCVWDSNQRPPSCGNCISGTQILRLNRKGSILAESLNFLTCTQL